MRSAATITEGARWLWIAPAQFAKEVPTRNHSVAHSYIDVDKEMAEASFTPF